MRKFTSRAAAKLFAVAGLLALSSQAACVTDVGTEGDTEETASQGDQLSYAPIGFASVFGTGAPPALWAYNSSGGGINVTSSGTGLYNVTFAGLGSAGGNVQVVAIGTNNSRCKVGSWGASGSDEVVHVRCHTASGSLVNSPFVVRFARPDGGYDGNGAYLWSGWAAPPENTPFNVDPTYSWNSSGGTNRVVRLDDGLYQAFLPGLSGAGGSVEITAYGGGSEHCKVGGWGALSGETFVNVYCFSSTGAPANTNFTLNYLAPKQVGAYNYGAYLWAHSSTGSDYVPSSIYSHNTGTDLYSSCPGYLGDNTA
ncbi:MAG: hypothetical protein KC492_01710, partial [Myxococcales bacterium]|nr:hypothetical protein [Myxococcales bacterium]